MISCTFNEWRFGVKCGVEDLPGAPISTANSAGE